MKVVVISDFDAVLTMEDKNFVLESGVQKIEFDFEQKNSLSFFVYPTKEKLLPYGVKVEKWQDDLICDSPHTKLYQVGENNFEVRLKKFRVSSFGLGKVYSKEIMGLSLMLLEGETSLFVVKDKEDISTFEIHHKFKEVAFASNENVPYFVATLKNEKYICVFCPTTQNFFAYEAISIKIDQDKIEIVQDAHSHAGHGKKIVLGLKEGRVVVEQEELLYLNQKPAIASNVKVVPLAFFESIKLGDYNLAKSYLSNNLNTSLNSEVLQEYFGDFVEVVPYNFSSEKGYFISVLTEKACKVFSFNFENGKINDINFLKEYAIKQK